MHISLRSQRDSCLSSKNDYVLNFKKGSFYGERTQSHKFSGVLYHPTEVFEAVLDGTEVVVQRDEGESITLMPGILPQNEVTLQKKIEAILDAAGSWRDVDTDALLAQLRSSRNLSTRPPVDL